jgi:hypothetical protein
MSHEPEGRALTGKGQVRPTKFFRSTNEQTNIFLAIYLSISDRKLSLNNAAGNTEVEWGPDSQSVP